MLHVLAVTGIVILCILGAIVLGGLILAAAILTSENPFR